MRSWSLNGLRWETKPDAIFVNIGMSFWKLLKEGWCLSLGIHSEKHNILKHYLYSWTQCTLEGNGSFVFNTDFILEARVQCLRLSVSQLEVKADATPHELRSCHQVGWWRSCGIHSHAANQPVQHGHTIPPAAAGVEDKDLVLVLRW